MKPFVRNKEYIFTYPDEMKKIISFLESIGTININYDTLERLYYDFSEECYSASWITVNEDILKEFARWLEDVDI